jgi:2-C-methyl-D-erythritol 4-phosphate cytidylyltransferase
MNALTLPDPDLTILIPAAGSGERLGLGSKIWLQLGDKSVLSHLARKAQSVAGQVVIAAPAGMAAQCAALCPGCQVIEGRATRQSTVQALLAASNSRWLLIQNLAEPFVSVALLRAVSSAARATGAAGAFLSPDVPVASIVGGQVSGHFAASEVGIFQNPQAFSRDVLEQTFAAAVAGDWQAQSTLQLVLRAGFQVSAVPGEKTNLKLTTADDWTLAQALGHLL